MVSIPDDLLERIDGRAQAKHESRSGFLRLLAERELAAKAGEEQPGIEALLGEPVRFSEANSRRSAWGLYR